MSEDYESITDHHREQAIEEMVHQFKGIWPMLRSRVQDVNGIR